MYTFTCFTIHTNNIISKKKKIMHTISNKHARTHTHTLSLSLSYIQYKFIIKKKYSELTDTHILFLESEIHRKTNRE